MYKIFCNEYCIHDTSIGINLALLLDCKLSLKEGSSGSLQFKMTPQHFGYNSVKALESTIKVFDDEHLIWIGRPITISDDFNMKRSINCEGALSFLNDTIIPPYNFEGGAEAFIDYILSIHNDSASQNRKLRKGHIDDIDVPSGNTEFKVTFDYSNAYNILNDKLISSYNGHLIVTYDNDEAFINYYATDLKNEAVTQEINFGINLLDYTKNFDYTNFKTMIIPLGADIDVPDPEDPDKTITKRLTIEDVGPHGIYLYEEGVVATYGKICDTVNFDDIDDAMDLMLAGEEYLSNWQFKTITIDLNVVDLHLLNTNIRSFRLFDSIRCISQPHGMNTVMPVTSISIDFNNPQNTSITLGYTNQLSSNFIDLLMEKYKKTKEDAVEEIGTNMEDTLDDYPEIGVKIVERDVIKAGTIMSTFCWSKFMYVDFLETNLDSILEHCGSTSSNIRNFIRIKNNYIQFFMEELDEGYEQFTDDDNDGDDHSYNSGTPLYWTAISGANAYKFFTYEKPETIRREEWKKFQVEGETQEQAIARMNDAYAVKRRKIKKQTVIDPSTGTERTFSCRYLKSEFAFESTGKNSEPYISMGYGDNYGHSKLNIFKDTTGANFLYTLSGQEVKESGFRFDDTGVKYHYMGEEFELYPYRIYESKEDADKDDSLPVGGIALIVNKR